jgi:hypothetical protein
MYKYRVLTSFEIHPRLWLIANEAVKAASRALSIQPPKLFFVERDQLTGTIECPSNILGLTRLATREIYVVADQSLNSIVRTVLHETQHAHHHTHDSESDEREAELFERRLWGSHTGKTRFVEIMRALENIGTQASNTPAPLRELRSNGTHGFHSNTDDSQRKHIAEVRANYYSKGIQARADFLTPKARAFFPKGIEFHDTKILKVILTGGAER